jgi:hypothetical protein
MSRRMLPPAAPLYALVIAYPLLWALGLAYFIWPLGAVLFALPLLFNRPVRVPPGFGLWMLFLVWTVLSATQVDTPLRLALLGWRLSIYLTATFVFLWIFNLPRRILPDRAIVGAMTLLWAIVILGGLAGVLSPSTAWHSFAEGYVPKSVLADPTGYAYVHPALVDTKFRALGYPIGRPKTFFAYTNQWGAAVGLLTPFALAAVMTMRRGARRYALIALLVISVVPIVISLNRGLWLGMLVALLYVAIRSAIQGNARFLLQLLTALALLAVAVVLSPLGSLLHERVSSKTNSNQTRAAIYAETISQVQSSPVFGFGSPRPTQTDILTGAHVGTQGQFFLVLFSQGVPGMVFFVGFFGSVFWRSCRGRFSVSTLWNIAIVIAGVEMWFYDFVPTSMFLLMVAAALACRGIVAGDYARATDPAVARGVRRLPARLVA